MNRYADKTGLESESPPVPDLGRTYWKHEERVPPTGTFLGSHDIGSDATGTGKWSRLMEDALERGGNCGCCGRRATRLSAFAADGIAAPLIVRRYRCDAHEKEFTR